MAHLNENVNQTSMVICLIALIYRRRKKRRNVGRQRIYRNIYKATPAIVFSELKEDAVRFKQLLYFDLNVFIEKIATPLLIAVNASRRGTRPRALQITTHDRIIRFIMYLINPDTRIISQIYNQVCIYVFYIYLFNIKMYLIK